MLLALCELRLGRLRGLSRVRFSSSTLPLIPADNFASQLIVEVSEGSYVGASSSAGYKEFFLWIPLSREVKVPLQAP